MISDVQKVHIQSAIKMVNSGGMCNVAAGIMGCNDCPFGQRTCHPYGIEANLVRAKNYIARFSKADIMEALL